VSDAFDPYVAWLDFASHDRAPGYYALLGLPLFEPDAERIKQALLAHSLNVSKYLHGPKRPLAEGVLAELNYAEERLTDAASKAQYDALLRQSLGDSAPTPVEPPMAVPPPPAVEQDVTTLEEPARNLADEHCTQTTPRYYRSTASLPQAAAAAAAQSRSLPPARRPQPQPITATQARLVDRLSEHRTPIAAGLVIVAALWGAYHFTTSRRPAPRERGTYIVVDAKEQLLITEQLGVLYDPNQSPAARAAAVERLRPMSSNAIRKYAGRLKDVAKKQPEPEIQQALADVLTSASVE
jgi:hypothetical protein